MSGTRFAMRLDPVWRPVLLVGGATQSNSYLEISGDALAVRFGFFYQNTLSLKDIESVEESDWAWWRGIGWRIGFGERFGLTGSYDGIVDIRLKESLRVWGFANHTCITVSLEDPKTFVAALSGLL